MRKGRLIGLVGLTVLGVLGFVVGCGDNPEPSFQPYVYEGKVPWDGGCPAPGINCPGEEAFECGMNALRLNHARCATREDCKAANGPDPADCYSMCGHAPINRNQETAYLREAKEEVFKYCNRARCTAYLECPRPKNAEIDCVDAGAYGMCDWIEGVFRFPDAGDTGPLPPPDAATPIPPDATTPEPPDADTPNPTGRRHPDSARRRDPHPAGCRHSDSPGCRRTRTGRRCPRARRRRTGTRRRRTRTRRRRTGTRRRTRTARRGRRATGRRRPRRALTFHDVRSDGARLPRRGPRQAPGAGRRAGAPGDPARRPGRGRRARPGPRRLRSERPGAGRQEGRAGPAGEPAHQVHRRLPGAA
ncbi:MAG: hypothetical protein QM765_15845 [Myxococcales bacterium]